jgi:peptidoglycan/xylan/chitin deacetylase (PgdA/CDA1 family)
MTDPSYYLFERYKEGRDRGAALAAYYRLRPLIPRRVQIGIRRAYARHQGKRPFPAWPIESVLVDLQTAELARRADEHDGRGVPFVNYWPDGRRFAFVLTHDVEGPAGVANIGRVREVEERHGLVSSWNFCAEEYEIPRGLFDDLEAAGCEIGLHGIDHRGLLFASRGRFEAALPKIHSYLAEWGADGFRSPALHRNADWMPELGCGYDSSFPDTDPFEPQPGGCCSIHPFFNGDLVELPVTLAQDHTLFEILRHRDIRIWRQKAAWIAAHHGLANVIVHPDYMLTPERLGYYDELLASLTAADGGWHALPRDVAAWWRTREELRCDVTRGDVRVVGTGAQRATVAYARRDGAGVVLEPPAGQPAWR